MARILLCIYFRNWRYNIIIIKVATEVFKWILTNLIRTKFTRNSAQPL